MYVFNDEFNHVANQDVVVNKSKPWFELFIRKTELDNYPEKDKLLAYCEGFCDAEDTMNV